MACTSNGVGTWLTQSDSLNRPTVHADPDDGSISGCGKPASSFATASYISYYPNGSVTMTQTPAEHAAGTGVVFTYDADGNETSETHHYNGIAGVTTKWYDGADRLVEVALPHDPSDYYSSPWLTRYVYDVTQGGFVTMGSSAPYYARGGLYKTQEWVTRPG